MSMDSDYCPWSIGYPPLDYALSICPQCKFIGRPDEFLLAEDKLVEDHPHQHWEETEKLRKEYPISKRFILYAERIKADRGADNEIADAYLRASWAERINSPSRGRSAESLALEKQCQQNAAEYFLSALQSGDSVSSVENLYLIGELHRRTTSFPAAIEYFDKAIREIEKERYHFLLLRNAGPQADVVEVKIRANSSIGKEECLRILKSVPCRVLGDLTFEKAREWKTRLNSVGAILSIEHQAELPRERQEFLNLIQIMRECAVHSDSENKTASSEYTIVIR
jgi:tetratricopeptide (TPR) repeat protein